MLVIGATRLELAQLLAELDDERMALKGRRGWPAVHGGRLAGVSVLVTAGGIGKANTAAALASVAAYLDVTVVLQVGIGGAYPRTGGGPGLPLTSVAVAASEFDLDLGVGEAAAWRGLEALGLAAVATEPPAYNLFPCDSELSTRVAKATASPLVPFATSDSVTADSERARHISEATGAAVESMEGAAAAQVCIALGLPFVELRAVSNAVAVRDKANWRIAGAIEAVTKATLAALPVLTV